VQLKSVSEDDFHQNIPKLCYTAKIYHGGLPFGVHPDYLLDTV
jgi:hypothetical protein